MHFSEMGCHLQPPLLSCMDLPLGTFSAFSRHLSSLLPAFSTLALSVSSVNDSVGMCGHLLT